MSDKVDPRAALLDGDVAQRAAAARVLACEGGWDDLAQLVDVAKSDSSASVRLYAAGAAADIALRARRDGALGSDRAAQILEWIRAFDPDVNPGLLMLLAAVATGPALERLGRMLRDPRNGVRVGAAMALRRAALSAASDPSAVALVLGGLLTNRKIPADAMEALIALVGEAGFEEHEDAVRTALAGPLSSVADVALTRLEQRREPSAWEGLWLADGADVFEAAEEGRVEGWLSIVESKVWDGAKPLGALVHDGVQARVGKLRLRLLWAPRAGSAETTPAIQCNGRTWWRADARVLGAVPEEQLQELPESIASAALREMEAVDGVQAQRARALVAWRAGALELAAELLDALAEGAKPRADLFWYLARVQLDQGRRDAARISLDRFLELSGRRARHRKEAEALRAELD